MKLCPGCKLPIDQCYYGGDCLEMQLIYQEQQKEMLADIDLNDITGECMVCGCLIDDDKYLCYVCEHGKD